MMQDNQGSALYCSNCTYARDGVLLHQVLGSITKDGKLIIKRAHNLNTILHVAEFTISCTCGYQLSMKLSNPSFKQTDNHEKN